MSEPEDSVDASTPEASTPEASASTPEPKKKRGKKAKAPEAPAPLPGQGTPEGAILRDANAAFEAGNYALVRDLTTKLSTAQDPKVVDAARDLARRVSVDPVQIAFLTACLVAIIVIFYVYVIR